MAVLGRTAGVGPVVHAAIVTVAMSGRLLPGRFGIPVVMGDEDLREVEENIRLLIRAELETQHRLEGHRVPLEDCPICVSHQPGRP
jgi:hypothetical protein